MKTRCTIILLAAAVSIVPGAHAHHSFASYDRAKSLTLAGTVKDFQWTNPHAWIQVTIPGDNGQPTEWGVECGSPNMMVRSGWKKTLLMPGDKVVVVVNPLLDGRGHPPDDEIAATWNGDSVGKWEGDVLVVDTVGTNGRARAANGVGSNAKVSSIDDDPRFPLSDALHLVERFKLVANAELLEDEITIEDPKFYTERVVLKHYFQRRPDIDMLEYFCGDNPRRD